MLQCCGEFDLGKEALGAEHHAQLRLQHLDGDLTLMLHVVGEVHRCHPAAANFALDDIPIGEGRRQYRTHIWLFGGSRHVRSYCSAARQVRQSERSAAWV